MQGKAKTIALVGLLLLLGAIATWLYWPDKPETTPPPAVGGDGGAAPAAPNGRPSRPDDAPAEPPPGRGTMSG